MHFKSYKNLFSQYKSLLAVNYAYNFLSIDINFKCIKYFGSFNYFKSYFNIHYTGINSKTPSSTIVVIILFPTIGRGISSPLYEITNFIAKFTKPSGLYILLYSLIYVEFYN